MDKTDDSVGKEVWMHCRSSRPCGGNNARIVSVSHLNTGGRSIMYKCLSCGKKFRVVA